MQVDDPASVMSSVSWIDWTAAAVLLVFVVAGLSRGLVWQLTRVGILVLAYVVAILAGPAVADAARELFRTEHRYAHDYLAFVVVFVAVLVSAGLLAWLVQKDRERDPLTRGERAAGGIAGVLTGGLIVLALLTAVHMLHDWTGGAAGIARAASGSHAQAVGQDLLHAAGRVLPEPWSGRSEAWRDLLAPPDAPR